MTTLRTTQTLARRLVYPPWRDPLVAAFMFVVSMSYLFNGLGEWFWTDWVERQTPTWVMAVVLTVMSGLELFRARASRFAFGSGVAITLVCVVWLGTSLPLLLILSDLLFAAVLYGGRRQSRLIVAFVALTVPVGTVAGYLLGGDWRTAVLVMLTMLLVPITTVTWAMQVRLGREVAASERTRAAQLERLVELDRNAAVRAERARMARDLHDVVAGQLSAIAIQSEALLAMEQRDPETEATVVRSVRENSVQALAEMRAMIGLLREEENGTGETYSTPRLGELDRLVESARAAGARLNVQRLELANATRAVEVAGYRIVQEALTNVVKHGGDGVSTLSVTAVDGVLRVEIGNPVSSPNGADGSGVGLETMRERAETVGGVLRVGPSASDDRIWMVEARLPLGSPEQQRSGDPRSPGEPDWPEKAAESRSE